ncbi:hypothetical protein KEM60_02590 [Austwickia sp. TVS 96-490-7B]|uniref:DUF3000 domain-containing protein n=1 Tax=Austwickia sp. TVS 96-490-7B TaxID=2830843 RepID=UPI001C5642C5|nr:DUF3000 domain-containing protein [Austwickia sp. TVS 96-490-7B]MBW3086373.1 hypothetical protein [Austwickia sp. TVS 96-490-7B]
MTSRQACHSAPEEFTRCVGRLVEVQTRPEVRLEEMPAPQRIAPFSAAVTADVSVDDTEEPLATGRFVVLHDPDEPAAWSGAWRIVTFASARLEPEMSSEPLLGEVGWSWLRDGLVDSELTFRALGGTVTRVVSDSFGSLAQKDSVVEIELRASWTIDGPDVPSHLRVWADVLATFAGLPPLPEGVVPLPGIRH